MGGAPARPGGLQGAGLGHFAGLAYQLGQGLLRRDDGLAAALPHRGHQELDGCVPGCAAPGGEHRPRPGPTLGPVPGLVQELPRGRGGPVGPGPGCLVRLGHHTAGEAQTERGALALPGCQRGLVGLKGGGLGLGPGPAGGHVSFVRRGRAAKLACRTQFDNTKYGFHVSYNEAGRPYWLSLFSINFGVVETSECRESLCFLMEEQSLSCNSPILSMVSIS